MNTFKFLCKNSFKGVAKSNMINYQTMRLFSDNFSKREKAEEKNYVNQQERDLLKKLCKKLKAEQNADHEVEEVVELKKIFGNHNITPSEQLINDIRTWRDEHH